jgi:glycosyltransferase involved in cell wall biosynthesis
MNSGNLKLLYVCTDFPYPPISGGRVDMWNRIQALHSLGITFDVIATVREEPLAADRSKVETLVRRLIFSKRKRTLYGFLSFQPGQTAIRSGLRHIPLSEEYDVVLMQTEFASEILFNKILRYRTSIIRVDNDECAFYKQMAKAERSPLLKLYFYQEALRIKLSSSRILRSVSALWFISFDELSRYCQQQPTNTRQLKSFVPSALDFTLLHQPPLTGNSVLFVGNLWAPLNREALEWYIAYVHPRLSHVSGYEFVIIGSTRGLGCDWIVTLTTPHSNIKLHFDAEDLSPFFQSSAVFVNPMQQGSGVKLKTIEALLRGLPVVSTTSGAEGSGLILDVHYKHADDPKAFAQSVQQLLSDKQMAHALVQRAQAFVAEHYNQAAVLEKLLLAI